MNTFRIQNISSTVIKTERQRVLALLDSIIAPDLVHEIGSTAIPGVIGKQDLDFLVLPPAAQFEETRAKLNRTFKPDLQQVSNEIFQGYKVNSSLDVSVQLTVKGGPYDNFLDFVKLLKNSRKLRDDYNKLKQSFEGHPMEEYRTTKREFIERIITLSVKEVLNNKLPNFSLRFGAGFVHLIERNRRNISDILRISRLKMDKICSKDEMKNR